MFVSISFGGLSTRRSGPSGLTLTKSVGWRTKFGDRSPADVDLQAAPAPSCGDRYVADT